MNNTTNSDSSNKNIEENSKITKLTKILGLDKENTFGLHEASKKIIYHKDNFSAFLEGRDEDIKPVCVEIVPSILCNFNCPSCTYRQNGSKHFATKNLVNSGLMSEKTFDSITSDLKRLNVKSAIITGGGEPSMNPNYINFIKKLKHNNFDVGLYSNAGLIANDMKELLEQKLSFIRLSLNSGDVKTHRLMYGVKDMFQTVVDNVIRAGKLKSEMPQCKTTLGLGFIMGSRNSSDAQLDGIAQTLEIIAKESKGGISYAAFRPEVQYFSTNPITKQIEICKSQPNPECFKQMYERLEEKIKKPLQGSGMNILITKAGFDQLANPYEDEQNLAAPFSISINYDGMPHLLSETNGNPEYCFASSKDERLYDSWNGQKKKEMFSNLASQPLEKNHIPTLGNYKLATTSALLREIRDSIGILSINQVEEFYNTIDLSKSIEHVNFI
jgi:organic radical activating enzyme